MRFVSISAGPKLPSVPPVEQRFHQLWQKGYYASNSGIGADNGYGSVTDHFIAVSSAHTRMRWARLVHNTFSV